jgi:hypothetical protein
MALRLSYSPQRGVVQVIPRYVMLVEALHADAGDVSLRDGVRSVSDNRVVINQ